MTDLLIRNLNAGLKKKLEISARKHRRNLSDEAKRLLDAALVEDRPAKPLGTALAEHFKGLGPVDLTIPRQVDQSQPPDFE